MKKTNTEIETGERKVILADTHCHLLPPWFRFNQIEAVIKRARSKNVKIIINSAISADNYEFGLRTTEFPGVYLSLGLGPSSVSEEDFNTFTKYFRTNKDKIVAIGEIGLDYHWTKESLKQEKQRINLHKLIQFALDNKKSIVIHSRKAEKDAIEILQEMNAKDVLMHCFDGTDEQVKQIIEEGWFISVPTSAVYRKNYMRKIDLIPPKNLMFETDSPFHSLERGKNNEPSVISILCKHAANQKKLKEEELARITTENVCNFYGIILDSESSSFTS